MDVVATRTSRLVTEIVHRIFDKIVVRKKFTTKRAAAVAHEVSEGSAHGCGGIARSDDAGACIGKVLGAAGGGKAEREK